MSKYGLEESVYFKELVPKLKKIHNDKTWAWSVLCYCLSEELLKDLNEWIDTQRDLDQSQVLEYCVLREQGNLDKYGKV